LLCMWLKEGQVSDMRSGKTTLMKMKTLLNDPCEKAPSQIT